MTRFVLVLALLTSPAFADMLYVETEGGITIVPNVSNCEHFAEKIREKEPCFDSLRHAPGEMLEGPKLEWCTYSASGGNVKHVDCIK